MIKTVILKDGNMFTGEFKGNTRNGKGVKTTVSGGYKKSRIY